MSECSVPSVGRSVAWICRPWPAAGGWAASEAGEEQAAPRNRVVTAKAGSRARWCLMRLRKVGS
ncbi:hypothetical protein [Streptomyces echinatus]|uniref:hypothetical protein n=1 Tax=Streptomyces echinatus TaxID=67293 RepID=UPI0031EC1A93